MSAGGWQKDCLGRFLGLALAAWVALAAEDAILARPLSVSVAFGAAAGTAACLLLLRWRPAYRAELARLGAAISAMGLTASAMVNGGPAASAWWFLVLVPLSLGHVLGVVDMMVSAVPTAVLAALACTLPPLAREGGESAIERALGGVLLMLAAAALGAAARRRADDRVDAIALREETIARQAWALAQAHDDLEDACDRALATSRAKTEFLATMSHELRTPLNGILGLGGVLLESSLDREQRELVAAIVASGESQRRLLDDALDLARIESGRLEIAAESVRICDCLEDVADLFSGRAAEKGLSIAVVIDPSVPAIARSDGLRVRQVVANLVGNAVKFTERGGVVVRARRLGGAPDGREQLQVVVEDTGPGIAPVHLELIFRAFEQADSSFARLHGGTGLGLAVSRHLARAMGGDIEVQSRLGQGSRFHFTWQVEVIERSASLAVAYLDRRLLLVDPEEVGRQAFLATAAMLGVHADAVSSVSDAVEHARRARPTALLLASSRSRPAADAAAALRSALGDACPPLVAIVGAGELGRGRVEVEPGVFAACTLRPLRRSRLAALLDELGGQAAPTPTAATGRSTHVRVLVVDDDATNRRVARLLLARLGWTVTEATSGAEALAALRASRFDVALLDLHMPHMDGFELAERILVEVPPEGRPILAALTASVVPAEHQHAFASGLTTILAKPIDRRALAAFVERTERALSRRAGLRLSSVPAPSASATLFGRPPSRAPRASTLSPNASADAEPPDLEPARLAELREVMGDDAATLIEDFLGDAAEQLRALEAAVAGRDLGRVARTAHRLAGASGTLGAAALGHAARTAEAAARARDSLRCRAAVAHVSEALGRARTHLRAALDDAA